MSGAKPTAAPDLLAALKHIDAMPYYSAPLADYQVDSLLKRYTRALDIARAAIAKAEESQP